MAMEMSIYLERSDVVAAEELIATYGVEAGLQAAEQAERSRGMGNVSNFCRWRQIERLIVLLSIESSLGTVH